MADTQAIAQLLRYYSLLSTTKAGSGHPTSSLSAADLMAVLIGAGFFYYDISQPRAINHDRLIFSKGHASPLFYALWTIVGGIEDDELLSLRKFGSRLEGHPTKEFPFTDVPTGSLGQGLSVGFGMALNAKYLDKTLAKTFVLLGDSELAEGSVWEAFAEASHYQLHNLIALIDMNRLGQRGETMLGRDSDTLSERIKSFGWEVITIDGHDHEQIRAAYQRAISSTHKPVAIIANTIKGKGVSFLEDKEGWHGKVLNEEQLQLALRELGNVDTSVRVKLEKREGGENKDEDKDKGEGEDKNEDEGGGEKWTGEVATRRAYGVALVNIAARNHRVVALDAEVSNSTFAEELKKKFPERFFEMYIAEQHMVSAAMGLAERGKIPFVSTFAAFFTRAADQIRMAGLARSNVKFVGSHAGVSIGEDGASQMGLEDIALFRAMFGSTVFYPSDAVSTAKLVQLAAAIDGPVYMRTTRKDTPVLYKTSEDFVVSGLKVLRQSEDDICTIIAAGITVHEALKAYDVLREEGIFVRVIDLYCIKPLDKSTVLNALQDTEECLVVEDHYQAGGIGEAISALLSEENYKVYSLAVQNLPRSGMPDELLDYEGISARAIVKKVKAIL